MIFNLVYTLWNVSTKFFVTTSPQPNRNPLFGKKNKKNFIVENGNTIYDQNQSTPQS
jgi:hypothetical protein